MDSTSDTSSSEGLFTQSLNEYQWHGSLSSMISTPAPVSPKLSRSRRLDRTMSTTSRTGISPLLSRASLRHVDNVEFSPKKSKRGSHEAFESRDLERELSTILHSDQQCKLFRDYLKKKKCEENLYFWLDVELFVDTIVTPEGKVKEKAETIFAKYFGDNALYQLNLDDEIVSTIRENMINLRTGLVRRDLFTEAEKAVFRLMETSCVSGFIRNGAVIEGDKLAPSEEVKRPQKRPFLASLLLPKRVTNTRKTNRQSINTENMETYFKRRPLQIRNTINDA